MCDRNRISSLALIAILAIGTAVPVWGQEPGAEPGQNAATPQPPQPEPDDPAVAAVLRGNPSTPAQLARAANVLAELGRPDLGRQLLQKLLEAKPNDEQLGALAEEFGSAMFLSMAGRAEMRPEAEQLADAVLAVVNRSLRDPARIAGLIGQLQDASPEARLKALTGLREARWAAVGPLLGVLADASRGAEQASVRAVLAEMGSDATGPLLGLLEASDPKLVAQAIRALAEAGTQEAVIYLLRPYSLETGDPAVRAAAGAALKARVGRTPTRTEAVRLLTERARAYFARRQPIKAGVDGRVELWRWDEDSRQCVSKSYPADEASAVMAARLARDAYALAGADPQIRRLYLAATLDAAAYEAGLDQPLPRGEGTAMAEAAALGAEVIEDLLEHAIAADHVPAATAAARILGRIGTADALLRQGTQPAVLVRATWHADRRLRMAATDAVIRLQPARSFPGSSHVAEALAFFAASSGARRALVAGPSTEDSRRLAGMLAAAGYQVDTAVTGRELGRLAVASPDYELALIDAAIERPTIDLLLKELRKDCRSGTLRVGLIARDGFLPRARHVARSDPAALAFSRPHSDESFARQLEQLTALAPRAFVDLAERQRQAAEALDRLAEVSRPGEKLYDVGRTQNAVLAALYTPGLGSKAAAVLGNLGNAESQRALVELASRWTQPLEVRRAAVDAFRQNSRASGILLTNREILLQYERYNQSENLDQATQQVLGSILDCIEAPTQPVQAKGESGKPKAEGGKGAL